MTYAQARRFAQEASKSGSVLGLASIRALMRELDNVQETLPIIHLAGTNGKGSVGAYLASIFCAAGLSVARYTSPAVFDPLEVFTYNGENITESEYAKVMSQVKDATEGIDSHEERLVRSGTRLSHQEKSYHRQTCQQMTVSQKAL